MARFDVAANRAARKYSRRELAGRVLWGAVWPLFRLVPRPLWGWRRLLLRLFGAQVGPGVHIHPTVRIMIPWNLTLDQDCTIGDAAILYALGPMRIGARAVVSQRSHLCGGTHLPDDPARALVRAPVTIGPDAWICAEAFVGPFVTIGQGAIVGARAVVVRDVPDHCTVVGNPARIVRHHNRDTEP